MEKNYMKRNKVVVLGVTGMLGAMILDVYADCEDLDLIGTYRGEIDKSLKEKYPDVEFRKLDSESCSIDDVAEAIKGSEWVVNAIGVIKPFIHDDNAAETERAIRVNGLFPYILGKAADQTNAKVIQIATDCVYSGEKGMYVEDDLHDALDVYGKSKSLGEAFLGNVMHVRCSIIGPELKNHLSLLDWFLGQEKGSTVNGYSNHKWNGVTTLQYAKIALGIIRDNIEFDHIQHVIPGNLITKANLLRSFAKDFGRSDIAINEVEAPKVVDRTLSTLNTDMNTRIWKAAGYENIPTVEEMVEELAKYGFGKASK
jgi:dTDP-4-dehydrorhamnose reductase